MCRGGHIFGVGCFESDRGSWRVVEVIWDNELLKLLDGYMGWECFSIPCCFKCHKVIYLGVGVWPSGCEKLPGRK